MEEFKAAFEMLEEAYKKLKAKQPKNSQQRNVENKTQNYIRKTLPYLRGVDAVSFEKVADGKGTPPPQERTLEPEIDDSESVVAASNAETPKAKAKAKRARKSKKTKK